MVAFCYLCDIGTGVLVGLGCTPLGLIIGFGVGLGLPATGATGAAGPTAGDFGGDEGTVVNPR